MWQLLAAVVLCGLAGPGAHFVAIPDLPEPVGRVNLMVPARAVRLRRFLAALLDAPRRLQAALVARSANLRRDLLERVRFGQDTPLPGRERRVPEGRIQEARDALHVSGEGFGDKPDGEAELSGDLSQSVTPRREDALLRPVFLLENPDWATLPSRLAGCNAGHALVTGRLDAAASRNPATRAVLTRVMDGMTVETPPAGGNKAAVGGHLTTVGATVIVVADDGVIEGIACREPEWAGQFVVLDPAEPGAYDPAKTVTGLTESLALALRETVGCRRIGSAAAGGMQDAAKGREFVARRLAFESKVEKAGEVAAGLAGLPSLIAWALTRMIPSRDLPDDNLMAAAFVHSQRLLERHLRTVDGCRARQQRASLESHAQKILNRVEARGRMTRREAVRGFDCQRMAVHEPAFRLLIERKLLREEGRELVAAAAGVSSARTSRQ